MTPFQQFRIWARRAPLGERAAAMMAAALVLGVLGWLLVPTGSGTSTNLATSARGASQGSTGASSANQGNGSTVSTSSSAGTGSPIGAATLEEASDWAARTGRADALILTGHDFQSSVAMLDRVRSRKVGAPLNTAAR